MKLKFQQSYLEKHSAYYTTQFPVVSQVHTHKHMLAHTHGIQNEAAKQFSQTGSVRQKHMDKTERRLLCEVGKSNYLHARNNIFH